ncbi:MAG: hypothetical protein JNK72_13450 [Myxococcales bacterium]|nr:hypothetical protein [Myxococcales bacterium]
MNRAPLSFLRAAALCALLPLGCGDNAGSATPAADAGARRVVGDEYCTPAATPPTCRGRELLSCGVCVAPPGRTEPMARTNCDDTRRREFCQTAAAAPNVSCFERANYPTAGASERVTLWGSVKVFGNGGDSNHIRVTVYRVGADGMPGEMLGTSLASLTHPAAASEDVYSPSGDQVVSTRRLGGYEIANIPTETELLVVAEGDPSDPIAAGNFSHKVYDYNLLLRNREIDAETAPAGVGGTRRVRFAPRVISNADWASIPSTSGLTAGITAGRGALAGEVHDCDDVRLSNVTIDSQPRRAWDGPVVFFSENDTNPLPDVSRELRGTSILGTYALLDMDPGPVTVSAMGYGSDRSTVLHVGSARARVFPGAITVVTLRGLRPWQVTR